MRITKKTIIILVVIIVTVISLIIYLSQGNKFTSAQIVVTSSVPTNNALEASVFDPIKITFNQTVDSSNITVTSEPMENWSVLQTTADTIQINHQVYLRVATKYKLTILQKNIIIGILTFQTAHEQNDPRQLQNLQSDLNKNYPLASFTPYQTSDYKVIYNAPLTLEIDITSSITTNDAILQVKQWVTSHGIDPETHKYNTKIIPTTSHP